jgi:hypothetical protein
MLRAEPPVKRWCWMVDAPPFRRVVVRHQRRGVSRTSWNHSLPAAVYASAPRTHHFLLEQPLAQSGTLTSQVFQPALVEPWSLNSEC